jgi:signal transduction histidine kinase
MYGAVTQLASGALDAAAAALELGTLAHGIDVMVGITSDMLDMEALRAGRLRIVPAPTDVRIVLAGCAKTSAGGVRVALEVASDVPALVDVDASRLRQVTLPAALDKPAECTTRAHALRTHELAPVSPCQMPRRRT